MRIALLATHFADYSLELASELAGSHEVLLIVDRHRMTEDWNPDQIVQAKQRMQIALVSQNRVDKRLWTEAWVRARLSAFRPDAVVGHEHAHPHITRMHRHAATLSRLLLVVHDPEPHQGRDAALAIPRQAEIQAQRNQAHHLFAHGPYCAERLRRMVPEPKPIHCIALGPQMRPASVSPPPGGRRALMFGRMEAYKGLELLLAACRILAARGAPADLHLAGRGPELDRLYDAFAALPRCMIERGHISRDRAIAAMQAADLVVAPYSEASQSGVVSTAFANGRPVLATRVGGLPDFIRDGVNGRLVAPQDAEALADALANWPGETASSDRGLWRGALATIENEMHWRIAAQAIEAAALRT